MEIIANKFVGKICRKLLYFRYRNTLPKNCLHDDVYIVEFPKSGVTWLGFLLGNIELQLAGSREKITFFNYHKWVVDVHQLGQSEINRHRGLVHTFIKSHSKYNPFYYFVIYLIRNPFDVMVSYYNFMLDLSYKGTFEEFVKDPNFGILAWKAHVKSWLYGDVKAQRIHLIKYEDIMNDTHGSLISLYQNLGVELEHDILKKAVDCSSFDFMKTSEEIYRKFNPSYGMSFVGKTNKLSSKELYTKEIVVFIESHIGDELRKYYPDYENNLDFN
jgi:hypothetical protein